MQLIRAGNHALRHCVVAQRNDQVIVREVQLLNRERHQWEITSILGLGFRQPLDKLVVARFPLTKWRNSSGKKSITELSAQNLENLFEDFLRTGIKP